jgi:hypothetical protein
MMSIGKAIFILFLGIFVGVIIGGLIMISVPSGDFVVEGQILSIQANTDEKSGLEYSTVTFSEPHTIRYEYFYRNVDQKEWYFVYSTPDPSMIGKYVKITYSTIVISGKHYVCATKIID